MSGATTNAYSLASSESRNLASNLTEEDLKMESSLRQRVCWTSRVRKVLWILQCSMLGSAVEKAADTRDFLCSLNSCHPPQTSGARYQAPCLVNWPREWDQSLPTSSSLTISNNRSTRLETDSIGTQHSGLSHLKSWACCLKAYMVDQFTDSRS